MLYTALVLGLLGSFHCIGMCGPIAFVLPVDKTREGVEWEKEIGRGVVEGRGVEGKDDNTR